MKRTKFVPALLVGLLAFGVYACGGGGGAGEEGDGGNGGDGEEQVVEIGYSGPLSGGAALYGENVLDGMRMAVEDLNEDGMEIDGQPATFEIASLDDRYLPNEAATNAQRLVQQDGVSAIFIPHSGGIFAAQGINTDRNPFLLGAYSSDPAILEQENPLTMMIPPRFDNYMEPFTELQMERFGDRLGLIPTESEYGQEWTDQISAEWESQGGEVLSNNGIDYSETTDYAGPVTQALSEDPDVMFIGGPSQPTALIVEEARNQGFEGGFILMDQSKIEEMEAFTSLENMEGSLGVAPLSEVEDPGAEAFVERYAEEITEDRPAVSEVAYNYQSVHILANAMALAGTSEDPEAIRENIEPALSEVEEEYQVANFPDGFTEEGHLAGEVLAVSLEDGEFVPVEVPQMQ
ncbi:MAG: ABC transporter substrate-binding protein [Rubrobacter sp.]|nr:ABC transporter substrate-binding protein [Rubrobacter sp.]